MNSVKLSFRDSWLGGKNVGLLLNAYIDRNIPIR